MPQVFIRMFALIVSVLAFFRGCCKHRWRTAIPKKFSKNPGRVKAPFRRVKAPFGRVKAPLQKFHFSNNLYYSDFFHQLPLNQPYGSNSSWLGHPNHLWIVERSPLLLVVGICLYTPSSIELFPSAQPVAMRRPGQQQWVCAKACHGPPRATTGYGRYIGTEILDLKLLKHAPKTKWLT